MIKSAKENDTSAITAKGSKSMRRAAPLLIGTLRRNIPRRFSTLDALPAGNRQRISHEPQAAPTSINSPALALGFGTGRPSSRRPAM
jgi:hypothetical protein